MAGCLPSDGQHRNRTRHLAYWTSAERHHPDEPASSGLVGPDSDAAIAWVKRFVAACLGR